MYGFTPMYRVPMCAASPHLQRRGQENSIRPHADGEDGLMSVQPHVNVRSVGYRVVHSHIQHDKRPEKLRGENV